MATGPQRRAVPIDSGLFLDQSTRAVGYAFVLSDRLVDYGVLRSTHHHRIDRLIELERDLITIMRQFRPQIVTVEDIRYFSSNDGDTAEAMAEATFIVRKAARQALPIFRPVYRQFPNQIKFAVTGKGNAHKAEVARIAVPAWNLPVWDERGQYIRYDDNATDALAAALAWRYYGTEIMQKQAREC